MYLQISSSNISLVCVVFIHLSVWYLDIRMLSMAITLTSLPRLSFILISNHWFFYVLCYSKEQTIPYFQHVLLPHLQCVYMIDENIPLCIQAIIPMNQDIEMVHLLYYKLIISKSTLQLYITWKPRITSPRLTDDSL